MKDAAINPLFLRFIDKQIENNFQNEYDNNNRIFFRIGIYLSCFAWFIWYLGIYFSHHNVFAAALTALVVVLGAPFVAVVILSFFARHSTLTHNITAFCNFAAAVICIYVAVYLIEDITFLCAGVICINFFCYFILRIRFNISFLVTFSYGIIAEFCVIASGNFTNNQIFTASSGIWLGFFIATISGYFFEKTNRTIFLQNKLINEQKEELIIDKEKLKRSIEDVKTTQAQLVHSEKMASLGELTAGIAHEIQNPLNFVNNFSEVNAELLEEMKDELHKGKIDDALALANDAIENQKKINQHGKRADSIVKGMLQHSRSSSTAVKEPTDINKLADEYLRLAYHGLRAKDSSFNATIKTEFDETIGNISIIPQDIGRVMLNLYTNAFYAVTEKKHVLINSAQPYEPTVTVTTKSMKFPSGDSGILVLVKDNGNGLPQNLLDKIFQPFFTTKPTGQGTGLGLSLSYDIIKAHGGELKVETKEGEMAEFIIQLPVK
jgi:signal transduction histidine kinase